MKKILKIGLYTTLAISSLASPLIVSSCSSEDSFGNNVNYAVASNGKRAKVEDIVEGNVDNGNFIVFVAAKWCSACVLNVYGDDYNMDKPWGKTIKENNIEVYGKKYTIYLYSSKFKNGQEEANSDIGKKISANRNKIFEADINNNKKSIPSYIVFKDGIAYYNLLDNTENPKEAIEDKIKGL